MPRRNDIESILIIGSGPIVIGQACEFDYSGTQACKALREDGYRVILVNSNPATIMTDPEMADATYVEPITWEFVAKVIEKEKPDVLLPTLGGQTGLNTAMELYEKGVLEKFGVEMIGANYDAIRRAEDRDLFRSAMRRIHLDMPRSGVAHSMEEARTVLAEIGLPCVIRPAFTLGGSGGGIAFNVEEFEEICARGIEMSRANEVLVEESIAGWKEYELEVMRDRADNVVIICSIENLDPMGVHTGDSITVAPAQTLTDREYQRLRDASLAIMREIGVETGGSNVQFAVNPENGRLVVIEMNPRVSRSSALASKATGFPIAKMAAKLAVGYTLDEIPNDITQKTPASFEPTIDYCVTKIPRFAFEKFPGSQPYLTTQMKSVGEVMAIGRTFKESLQKALRGLEVGRAGFGLDKKDPWFHGRTMDHEALIRSLRQPNPDRIFHLRLALKQGMTIEEVYEHTKIDRWFLANMAEIVEFERKLLSHRRLDEVKDDLLREAKSMGFSDQQLALIWSATPEEVHARRRRASILPVYRLVDTCAAEFEAYTPYYYSTYETEDEVQDSDRPKVVILGGGPNRIGQGIEFDYCCCHAAFALADEGYLTIMVNSNPETVSTDFDTSDRLYFEPLTLEDVLHICEREKPIGVIVQYGGQTPLNLAKGLHEAGVPLLGTSVDSIDRAEDRERFSEMLRKLEIPQTPGGMAVSEEQAIAVAQRIGYPVLVRPSYVLGGRAMEIVYAESDLRRYVRTATEVTPERPVLIDKFLEGAIEVDVDAVADGQRCVIGAIMEHIEEAGVHSGDSSCVIPAFSLGKSVLDAIRRYTHELARELNVIGLMNIQYAVKGDQVYVLEVNPRASRTVPFVSKTIGRPLAKIAACVMVGKTLEQQGLTEEIIPEHTAVKSPVFPFIKFPGVDIMLGPEMRSTGEVMGIDDHFGSAFAKACLGAGLKLPTRGTVFVSIKDSDKRQGIELGQRFAALGFRIIATGGTHDVFRRNGIPSERVNKVHEGRPNVVDALKNREVDLVINTPLGGLAQREDEGAIRKTAVSFGIPCITTLDGALAAVKGIEAMRHADFSVRALQEYQGAPSPTRSSASH
ncbi:MAG: carbamoyl-phosphate synthase large subunit [Planctomycetes bacterium]|nr:carbamoyl-phosphate synthase large subunit [Planctomycetota bacterium]MCB9890916.1 carbamoyl-phosphate synthase large subunit [Planctomycetota bacterium]